VAGYCQKEKNIVSQYGHRYSTYPVLIFYSDSTFTMEREEYESYPSGLKQFTSTGVWSREGHIVTLNPGKEKRISRVKMITKEIEGQDSICIKVNCVREEYENEVMVRTVSFGYDRITLYINKIYLSLVHEPIIRRCSYAPRIRNQVVLDSLNVIKLPRLKIEQLAIRTYGFDEKVMLPLANPNANYYEITIIKPVDTDRRPRGEKMYMTKKYLYDYDGSGRPSTLWDGEGLIKMK
jgi:hypothetical protein